MTQPQPDRPLTGSASATYVQDRPAGTFHANDYVEMKTNDCSIAINLNWALPGSLASSAAPELLLPETTRDDVRFWAEDIKGQGIRSIICLLSANELTEFYRELHNGLPDFYRSYGFEVTHIPASDYMSPPLSRSQLGAVWIAYSRLPKPVLIHCNRGIARSGSAVRHIQRMLRRSAVASPSFTRTAEAIASMFVLTHLQAL